MSIIGREINIGLGVETTSGTAVSPTIYPKWLTFDVQAVSEKELHAGQAGNLNINEDAIIRRKYGTGNIEVVPDVEIAPYFLGLALGSVSSTTAAGEAAVYEHTITEGTTNVLKTITLIAEEQTIVIERYTYGSCNTLELNVSDGLAKMSMELFGKFPTSTTLSESFTAETLMAYKDYTAGFGASVSDAESASATKLTEFTFTHNNNINIDDAFQSGSNAVDTLTRNATETTLTYTLDFANVTELNKYKNDTRSAMVVSFTGVSIGNAETEEIKLRFAELVLTDEPRQYDIDGRIRLTQNATCVYDAEEAKTWDAIVTNEKDGTNY